MSHTAFGSMRKATTICKSALSTDNSERNSGFFKFLGWRIFSPFSCANTFTADGLSFCPLPAGLSGAVMTPTTGYSCCSKAAKVATANSGVPIKTIRGWVILQRIILVLGIHSDLFIFKQFLNTLQGLSFIVPEGSMDIRQGHDTVL